MRDFIFVLLFNSQEIVACVWAPTLDTHVSGPPPWTRMSLGHHPGHAPEFTYNHVKP